MELSAEKSNLSGSSNTQEVTSSLSYGTTGDARIVSVLYKEMEELKKKVNDLQVKKIIDETQFSPELLQESGLLPPRLKKLKRGTGYRPLLKSEIEEAKTHSDFAAGQARWLGVAFSTFKKYAQLYGIYTPQPTCKGMKYKKTDPTRGKYPLVKILEGEFNNNPSVTNASVRKKLITSNTLPTVCNICGYNKVRFDGKIALLLDHMDGNQKNFKRDNLQLLCYNCTFECGRGYIRRGNHMFDPDWLEGCQKERL